MSRVKRGVTAHARHKKVLEGRSAGLKVAARTPSVPPRPPSTRPASMRAMRSPRQEAQLPRPVDPAHQRCRARSRPDLRSIYRRPSSMCEISVTAPQGALRSRDHRARSVRRPGRPGQDCFWLPASPSRRPRISALLPGSALGFFLEATKLSLALPRKPGMARGFFVWPRNTTSGTFQMSLDAQIATLRAEIAASTAAAADAGAIEAVRVSASGKKGSVSALPATSRRHCAGRAQGVGRRRHQRPKDRGHGADRSQEPPSFLG